MAKSKTAGKKTTGKKTATTKRVGRTPSRAPAPATETLVTGGTQEVVVQGRPTATLKGRKRAPTVVQPDHKLAQEGDTETVLVKAVAVGEYGHKRRRIGEVFEMHVTGDLKELPSWVIDLADADVGQDEGTRGLHSGGREDDRIRAERKENQLKIKGKGAKNIVDSTIVNDALPLGEGGNERKPASGDEHVI